LRYGYVYEGTMRTQPSRRSPRSRVDSSRQIFSIQNHDFIGNHPLGKRFHQLTSPHAQRAAAAILILAPAIPMLFMGEEFCCEQPFRFFVDFSDQRLCEAVIEGRRREYPQHDWNSGSLPTEESTFEESKIGPVADCDLDTWQWYQTLIKLRKAWRASGLLCDQNLTVETELDNGFFGLRYTDAKQSATIAVRLTDEQTPQELLATSLPGEVILNSRPGELNQTGLLPNHAVVTMAKR
jgi:1,4-alpha-glucan branching enzyme